LGEAQQNACPTHITDRRARSYQVIRAWNTKKVPWHWDEVHQKAFDYVKDVIAKDVALAYPDYSKAFEIYTGASS